MLSLSLVCTICFGSDVLFACVLVWICDWSAKISKFRVKLKYTDDILAAFEKEQDSLKFLNFSNNKHRNIKFTIEKQIHHSIAFLDAFILGIDNQNFTLQTYHKSIISFLYVFM